MNEITEDLLQRARAERFVGRKKEIELVSAMLKGEVPYRFLYLSGPGGVGKTELLHAFSRLCPKYDTASCYIYLPGVERSRRALKRAFDDAIRKDSRGLESTSRGSGRRILLLVDGFEYVSKFEEWVREELFCMIPNGVWICFAGRHRLAPNWSSDPGWHPLLSVVQLSNFDAGETGQYLRQSGVPAELHDTIATCTGGHPLTLSLMEGLSEQSALDASEPIDGLALIPDRMAELLDSVPSPVHRETLELAAVAMCVTEDLLLDVDASESGFARYHWLRRLPFVDEDKRGLVLQEASREVILKHLEHFNITRLRWLSKRLNRYFLKRLEDSKRRDVRHWLLQIGFLTSHFQPVRMAQKRELTLSYPGDGRPGSPEEGIWADVEAMVLEHEGPRSLELFQYWRSHKARLGVVHGEEGGVEGFLMLLRWERIEADSSRDPGFAAIQTYLQEVNAFRDGKSVVFVRYWMARDTYQEALPVRSLLDVAAVEALFAGPRPWGVLFCMEDEQDWILRSAGENFRSIEGAGFELDGTSYFWAGANFEETTLIVWLSRMVEATIGAAGGNQVNGVSPTKEEFERSVRAALHFADQPERLYDNALLHSRMVSTRVDALDTRMTRARLLVQIIREEAEAVLRRPGDDTDLAVIEKTYLKPMGKHDIVAAVLRIPRGTYERRLGSVTKRLVEGLWEREQSLLQ